MIRRDFLKYSATAGTLIFASPSLFLGQKRAPEYVVGHGDFKYKVDKSWGATNAAEFPVNDCHEMVCTKEGQLILLTNEPQNNILIFNPDGKVIDSWTKQLSDAHGLTLHDENGTEFLYITDYEKNEVYKTTLSGDELLKISAPLDSENYTVQNQFKPTETAIAPNGDIYVADGYGAQWISVFDAKGKLKNVFAGPEHFQNAHGICIDTRFDKPTLLITARQQNKLKRFGMEGNFIQEYHLPGAQINRPVIDGDEVYLSVLKSGIRGESNSGFVMILNRENKLVSCPAGAPPIHASDLVNGVSVESWIAEQAKPTMPSRENKPNPKISGSFQQAFNLFSHPHDVCIDADKNIYVPQWKSGKIYPIKLERI